VSCCVTYRHQLEGQIWNRQNFSSEIPIPSICHRPAAFAVFYFILTYAFWNNWAHGWLLINGDEKEFGRLCLCFYDLADCVGITFLVAGLGTALDGKNEAMTALPFRGHSFIRPSLRVYCCGCAPQKVGKRLVTKWRAGGSKAKQIHP